MKKKSTHYKYSLQIKDNNLNLCPPKNVINKDITGFRFTKGNVLDQDAFIPQGIKNPQRINSLPNLQKCMALSGLSFFDTEDAAKIKFSSFPKRAKKKLGYSHIAKGNISKTDGTVTEVNNQGHFTLFEYDTTELNGKFVTITELMS